MLQIPQQVQSPWRGHNLKYITGETRFPFSSKSLLLRRVYCVISLRVRHTTKLAVSESSSDTV